MSDSASEKAGVTKFREDRFKYAKVIFDRLTNPPVKLSLDDAEYILLVLRRAIAALPSTTDKAFLQAVELAWDMLNAAIEQ